jgi:hypothetical protein
VNQFVFLFVHFLHSTQSALICYDDRQVAMSAVKLPGEVKQNNLPPECGQPIDAGVPTAM